MHSNCITNSTQRQPECPIATVEIIAKTAEWNLEHKSKARLEKRFDGNFVDTEIKIPVSL